MSVSLIRSGGSRFRIAISLCVFCVLLVMGVAGAAGGSLDPTFGTGGKVTTDNGVANAIVLQANGGIVAIGGRSLPIGGDFTLARYKDGNLDPSFGNGGIVETDLGQGEIAFAGAIQPNGKIIAAGVSGVAGTSDFALVRYKQNGSLDPSFGNNGVVLTDFSGRGDVVAGIALQPDGKIVAAGSSAGIPGRPSSEFAIARYNADGSLDQGFASGGKALTSLGGIDDQAAAVAIQPSGKIVAVGLSTAGAGGSAFAAARYNENGSLDQSFGNAGKVLTNLGGFSRANGIALQRNGKIVAAGSTRSNPFGGSGFDFALVRYNENGSLDSSFGTAGVVTTDLGDVFDMAFAVAVQKNGRIVAAGGSFAGGGGDFAVVRYLQNGSLDSSFGNGGAVLTDFGSLGEEAHAAAIQPNGKIVAGGFGGSGFGLARYLGG